MDRLYEAGLSSLFVEVASEAISRLGVSTQRLHLDATSFHLHGRYPQQQEQQGQQEAVLGSEQKEPEPIRITYGYSRDHRPDLKQFVVDLLCSGDGGIPAFFRAANGNDSDAATFASLIAEFREQVGFEALFVADAALYTEHNLQTLKELSWVSRVPQTLKQARAVLEETDEQASRPSGREGYGLAQMRTDYAGVPQRWVIVSSEARAERMANQLDRRLDREETQLRVELRKLKRRSFNCESDARQEISRLDERLRFHRLGDVEGTSESYYARRGRPRKGEAPHYRYRITAEVVLDEEAVERARRRVGRFVLATNVLDEESLPAEEVLEAYLQQGVVERGFRFLKDPMFFAEVAYS